MNSKKKTILQGEFTLVGDEDNQGGIWVYSRSKGLGYLANQQLEFLDNFQLRPDNSIVMSELNMIISNEKSIYQYDVKNNLFVGKVDFNLTRSISDLYYQKSNGVLWLTARQYIARLKNGTVESIDLSSKEHSFLLRRIHFGKGETLDSCVIVHSDMGFALLTSKGIRSSCEFENIISAGSIQNKVWLNCSDGLYLKEV